MKRNVKKTGFIVAVLLLTVFLICIYQTRNQKEELELPVIKIAIPYSDWIQDANSNYYTKWLEEKCNIDIEFTTIRERYSSEYIKLLLTSENSDIDAIFFPRENGMLSENEIEGYEKSGDIITLEHYISKNGFYIKELWRDIKDYDLKKRMTNEDGHICYIPFMNTSRLSQNQQIFWIHTGWLKNLGLEIPSTIQQLESTLSAFLTEDPNGNGIQDEIPLIGCEEDNGCKSYLFLMNAFVYTDPENDYCYLKDGRIQFAPVMEAWREGLKYCHSLYEKGYLCDRSFTYTNEQVRECINDKNDIVGAFTSKSIGNYINQDSMEMLNQYVGVVPLEGKDGTRNATRLVGEPQIGAVVTKHCKNPEKVVSLLDIMLSEEASLIATYGEEGVDWESARTGDISQYGTKASIYIKNSLDEQVQNQMLAHLGPCALPQKYYDGVTWNGIQSDKNYIDVRNVCQYEKYYPREKFSIGACDEESIQLGKILSAVVETWMKDFITGAEDVNDDSVWSEYKSQIERADWKQFLSGVQSCYEEGKKGREK